MAQYYQKVYDQGASRWCYYVDTVVNPSPLSGDTSPNWVGPITQHCVIRAVVDSGGGTTTSDTTVSGFDDFDGDLSAWAFSGTGVNGRAAQNPNTAVFGRPSHGTLILETVQGSGNSSDAWRKTSALTFDTGEPIVVEFKFLPASVSQPTATAPGATSLFSDNATAPTAAIEIPVLTGEGDTPFWAVIDNGVDPAETVRVTRRSGTLCTLDNDITYNYTSGASTAAYAGPAGYSLDYSNDEFTWLLGVSDTGVLDGPATFAVVFGGIWDDGSSTMTNAVALLGDGPTPTIQSFAMPALGGGLWYKARLTVEVGQVTLEMAVDDGAYSTVSTYVGAVPRGNYSPFLSSGSGGDVTTRSLVVDWVRWSGLRANADTEIEPASVDLINNGPVLSTRTITAGTGLTGGGDLSADRTLSVDFGTVGDFQSVSATTTAEGSTGRVADAGHTHAHGYYGGGSDHHTSASTIAAGFMSAADKSKSDTYPEYTSVADGEFLYRNGTSFSAKNPALAPALDRATAADDTLSATTDVVLRVDTSGGNRLITLPNPTTGRTFTIKKITTDVNTISLVRFSTEQIEGVAATYLLPGSAATSRPAWMVWSDGTNWWVA